MFVCMLSKTDGSDWLVAVCLLRSDSSVIVVVPCMCATARARMPHAVAFVARTQSKAAPKMYEVNIDDMRRQLVIRRISSNKMVMV